MRKGKTPAFADVRSNLAPGAGSRFIHVERGYKSQSFRDSPLVPLETLHFSINRGLLRKMGAFGSSLAIETKNKREQHKVALFCFGSGSRTRTCDILLNREAFYH